MARANTCEDSGCSPVGRKMMVHNTVECITAIKLTCEDCGAKWKRFVMVLNRAGSS